MNDLNIPKTFKMTKVRTLKGTIILLNHYIWLLYNVDVTY